jgi:hypothetical protein
MDDVTRRLAMHRRDFLATAAALVASSVVGLQPARAQGTAERARSIAAWKGRIQSILAAGRMPIIDTQATYVPGQTNIARMIGFMNETDVAQIVWAPAFSADGSPSLKLAADHPEHFIPATNSGEFSRWWGGPRTFVSVAESDLATGRYFMMGEHEFRHYPSPEQAAAGKSERDITIPIDGPAGEALFALSERTGVAFQIHYEIEDRLLPALEAMLVRYPRARAIWCHLGMIRYPDRSKRYGPDYVVSLIEKHPGLHFDLAVPAPGSVYRPSGARDSTIYNADGLTAAWKAVIERHPDRFLAASDYRPPVEQNYPEQIARQRRFILGKLSDPARHLVAYRNAWRLITGDSWA